MSRDMGELLGGGGFFTSLLFPTTVISIVVIIIILIVVIIIPADFYIIKDRTQNLSCLGSGVAIAHIACFGVELRAWNDGR